MLTIEQYRAVVYRGFLSFDSVDSTEWRAAKDAALKKLKSLYQSPERPITADGDEIIVSYGGLKHALSKRTPTLEKTLVSLHIQEIIRSSKKVRTEPDRLGRKDPNSVSYYETKARIDGDYYEISVVVRNHSDGKRHYDHAVVKGKAHQGYSRVGQGNLADSPTRPFGGLDMSLREIAILVKNSSGEWHDN